MEGTVPKTKIFSKPFIPQKGKDKMPTGKEGTRKERLDEATRNELRRKNLCFHCKDPWVPGHKCQGKGQAHYIEVHSYSDEEEEQKVAPEQGKEQKEEIEGKHSEEAKEVVIASLSGTPRFNTFRVRGFIRGQGVTALIDGGEIHKFIGAT